MDERTFLKAAASITLTPRERVTLKESVMNAINAGSRHWWVNPFKSFASITASVLIVSIAGASVSYAAEDSMPGDLLYPVKMHVNEKIESGMARTPEARAIVATRHTEKRLKEAEMLAQKSALDMEKQAMLAEEVRKNVVAVQGEVASLVVDHEMDKASMIGMNLEASLNAHTRLLARLNAEHTGNEMTKLMDTLHETRMGIEESTIAAIDRQGSIATLVATARAEINRANRAGSDAKNAEAEEQLSEARQALDATDADGKLSSLEQLKLARTALRRAKEATVISGLPASTPLEPSSAAPTLMMMKTAPVTDTESGSDENRRERRSPMDREDLHFDASVRMRVTEKKLDSVRKSLERHKDGMKEGMSLPVETRINGSRQLMDMAKMQMEEGNMDEAFDASDAALKHAEEASKAMKMMMPDDDE